MEYIQRCMEDDIRCQTTENLAVPTYDLLVEDAKERRAAEVELEEKRETEIELEKKRAEADEILASSTTYYYASKVAFVICIVVFVSFSLIEITMGHMEDPKAVFFMGALVFTFLASFCLAILLFLYSYWILWY